MASQYQLEQTISANLKSISKNCMRYGIPAMCYHLFPLCVDGQKRSRLCQNECTKVKTKVCSSEVSWIRDYNTNQLQLLFPECSNLPRADALEGTYCVDLGVPTDSSKNLTLYGEYD